MDETGIIMGNIADAIAQSCFSTKLQAEIMVSVFADQCKKYNIPFELPDTSQYRNYNAN